MSPDRLLRLPDGRCLSYADYGDPDGMPVLAMRGCPDPDREVAAMFGVARKIAALAVKRTTFVIDTDRTLLAVIHSEVSMNQHADEALAVLRGRTA